MRGVNVSPDIEALSRAAAEDAVLIIRSAVAQRGTCALALSGGNTPRSLYRLLGTANRNQIPWEQVHLFWGDERYVPPDDPASNYRMVRETLLAAIPIPAGHVHPMPTNQEDPNDAAREYEVLLKRQFNDDWPRFDLILLGLAPDGHIASLFPGSKALVEEKQRVLAVRVPKEPPQRLTLTLPAINHAANVHFLVAGRSKAGALHRVLVGPCDVQTCPAVGVKPINGTVTWWVDEAAAAFLGARLSES
ncbi:MAG TPA: 6-phosphogluconolactonase [bacterium]|nr:6-phosphogluconolactonase [bacterium]